MPPALTPALALDYVRELSADVRDGVVLDAAGELLAGPPHLAAGARALLDAAATAAEIEAAPTAEIEVGPTAEIEVGTADGVVCAVRSSAHAAVAVCGRFAIPGIVREDLRAALAALEGRHPASAANELLPPPQNTPDDPLTTAAAALISTCQRGLDA